MVTSCESYLAPAVTGKRCRARSGMPGIGSCGRRLRRGVRCLLRVVSPAPLWTEEWDHSGMGELQELLERFRRGPELVATATTGAAGSQLDYRPAPGTWSVRQIVCHLADMEMAAAVRLRKIIAEDNPSLDACSPEAWAERLNYTSRRFSQALESFRRIRAENHALLEDLPEETYFRTGVHPTRGAVTLLDTLRHYAEHAENHARQIMKVRSQYKQSKATGGSDA
jgi:hypothetical protein